MVHQILMFGQLEMRLLSKDRDCRPLHKVRYLSPFQNHFANDEIAVANQKGKYLAKKLNKIVKDQDSPKPFEFHNSGSLAYIGNWFIFLNTIHRVLYTDDYE